MFPRRGGTPHDAGPHGEAPVLIRKQKGVREKAWPKTLLFSVRKARQGREIAYKWLV